MFSENEKARIITAIEDRFKRTDKKSACPMCGHNQFTIADAYLRNDLQEDLGGGISIGGPSIPSVAIICMNCGFISQHALGVLDLVPEEGNRND